MDGWNELQTLQQTVGFWKTLLGLPCELQQTLKMGMPNMMKYVEMQLTPIVKYTRGFAMLWDYFSSTYHRNQSTCAAS